MQTEILDDPAPWARCFAEERAIVCRDVFDAPLFDRIFAAARSASFCADSVPELGTREVEEPPRIGNTITLLLQHSGLLRWLEQVTGRTGLAGAEGRLVQTRIGGDALDWHNDMQGPRRALGLTICLADADYAGGLFEMRRVDDPASGRAFAHARAGTALIFDIGNDVEHRVQPVLSGGPRRVFTGWFLREKVLPSSFA